MSFRLALPDFPSIREEKRRNKENLQADDLSASFRRILREYDGSEKEFGEKLAEALPVLLKEEAEQLTELVNAEAFGRPDSVSSGDLVFAEELYERIRREIFSELTIYRKLWFYAADCVIL